VLRALNHYTTLNPAARAANADTTPVLPTSEFYKEWLPGKQQGDEAIGAVGSLFGGVGAGKLASGVVQGGKAAGLHALKSVARGMEGEGALSQVLAPAQPAYVVKPKGGNWLNGSVEDALARLKKSSAYVGMPADAMEASVGHDAALNTWIDKQLTRYVKNDMATPGDQIRALAENGTLHYTPPAQPYGPGMNTTTARRVAGFPEGGVAQSDLAKGWESTSDKVPQTGTYASHTPFGQTTTEAFGDFAGKNPDKEALATNRGVSTSDLGFNHLIDELRNATDPTSGLPAHLRLDPTSLDRVSVPQAVQRVADINTWRAAQKAEADAARANNPATHVVKEYPHSEAMPNPQGLKWVQLKAADGAIVQDMPADIDRSMEEWQNMGVPTESYNAAWKDYTRGQEGEGPDISFSEALYKNDPEWVSKAFNLESPSVKAGNLLREALKYEGDTMGHCVGGYCDRVADGSTQIFSLRDAKGQPHTTIEVAPGRLSGQTSLPDWSARYNEVHGEGSADAFLADHPEIEQAFRPSIIQIKGKGNLAPVDQYLPFVQDFVKNGNWSDVGDLANSGLRKTSDAFNGAELSRIKEAGHEVTPYMTPSDIQSIGDSVWPGQYGTAPGIPTQNFAEGGSVKPVAPPTQAPTSGWSESSTNPDYVPDTRTPEQIAAWDAYTAHAGQKEINVGGAGNKMGFKYYEDGTATGPSGNFMSADDLKSATAADTQMRSKAAEKATSMGMSTSLTPEQLAAANAPGYQRTSSQPEVQRDSSGNIIGYQVPNGRDWAEYDVNGNLQDWRNHDPSWWVANRDTVYAAAAAAAAAYTLGGSTAAIGGGAAGESGLAGNVLSKAALDGTTAFGANSATGQALYDIGAYSGAGAAGSAATPLVGNGTGTLWQQAQAAYSAAQPYIKGANAIKAAASGNPMGAVLSYVPTMDMGLGAAGNNITTNAMKTIAMGGDPTKGLINGAVGAGVNYGMDSSGLSDTLGKTGSNLLGGAVKSAVLGGDPTKGLVNGVINAGMGSVADFAGVKDYTKFLPMALSLMHGNSMTLPQALALVKQFAPKA
jgi:hypothetical protein